MSSAAGSLQGLVDPRYVFTDVGGTSAEQALGAIAERLAAAGVVTDAGDLARRLIERERLGSTGVGNGIAIPHVKSKDVEDLVVAIATLRPGADFGAADGRPVTLAFLVISPASAPALHLQTLARISRLVRREAARERIRAAQTPEEVVAAITEADAATTSEIAAATR